MLNKGVWKIRLRSLLGWSGLALGSWTFCLLVLQVLFGQQLEQLQTAQLGRDLALNVRLTELALERYPPHLVTELTGLDLAVAIRPKPVLAAPSAGFQRQIQALQNQLCERLSHCPMIIADQDQNENRGVWIELISPL